MPIQILSPEVASQIAAGEVVERPASVVKELLENSLDAGASQVTITVEGAGQRLVEVADNGSGIPAEELPVAIARHATSKLARAEDLFRITTLGFRGEALASIGSVSRLTITSKPSTSPVGARLEVEGGQAGRVQPVGAPAGTVVRVENLFYNVPARRKFLKNDLTERRQIDTLVTRYALAYPQVRFHLRQEGRSALQTSGNGDRREVLAALYGVEIARQMLEVLSEDDGLAIHGFISPTSLTRSNRREITFFVNGRPVQDAALAAAFVQAYHTLLMVGRYPLGVLFLEVQLEAVDVNVHPTKAEVRFREADRVFRAVQRAVRRSLLAHSPVPQLGEGLQWSAGGDEGMWNAGAPRQVDFDPWMGPEGAQPVQAAPDISSEQSQRWETGEQPEVSADPGPAATAASAATLPDPVQPALATPRVPLLRLVGQVATAYLVAEGPDGLYLIDQHAAHERVLFERFLAQLKESGAPAGSSGGAGEPVRRIPSQALLQPVAVDLPPASARSIGDQLTTLEHLGFVVEPFGPGTFLVRAIPAILAGMDPAAALRVLVEDFDEDETPLQEEVEARLIARVCKRAAVKAGQVLSPEEQRALLTSLESCRSPRTCPHGRPTMIHLSVDLLERQFGRRGAR